MTYCVWAYGKGTQTVKINASAKVKLWNGVGIVANSLGHEQTYKGKKEAKAALATYSMSVGLTYRVDKYMQ